MARTKRGRKPPWTCEDMWRLKFESGQYELCPKIAQSDTPTHTHDKTRYDWVKRVHPISSHDFFKLEKDFQSWLRYSNQSPRKEILGNLCRHPPAILYSRAGRNLQTSPVILRASRRHYKSTHIIRFWRGCAKNWFSILQSISIFAHVTSIYRASRSRKIKRQQKLCRGRAIPCGILPETTGSCWFMLVVWFCLVLAPRKTHLFK